MPANNLNVTIVGQALATNKSVKGISLDTTTLEAKEGTMLSPLEKTLSNCVLGSYIASAGASTAITQLSAFDPATMMGDMDPAVEIDKITTQMADIYTQITNSRTSLSEYDTYLDLIPLLTNGFAIVLIVMTAAGLILGFLNCKSCGSCLICCSSCLSIPCLLLS